MKVMWCVARDRGPAPALVWWVAYTPDGLADFGRMHEIAKPDDVCRALRDAMLELDQALWARAAGKAGGA